MSIPTRDVTPNSYGAFSHWILLSQTEMRADFPLVYSKDGVSSWYQNYSSHLPGENVFSPPHQILNNSLHFPGRSSPGAWWGLAGIWPSLSSPSSAPPPSSWSRPAPPGSCPGRCPESGESLRIPLAEKLLARTEIIEINLLSRHHVCLSLSYFVNLRFSQLNNCVRLLEGRYFASVSDEVLHNSWSRWQDHGPVQIWIELLLTK